MKNIAGIILAAGRGTRFKSKTINKVVLRVRDKPIIFYAIELLKKIKVNHIIVVVGFARESIEKVLEGKSVIFAQQKKPLGTGDAVSYGLKKIPKNVNHVIVLNGDDALFLNPEIINNLLNKHLEKNAALSLLTIELSNPKGIGRVVRSKDGNIVAIVEERDANPRQRAIREVNGLGYVFSVAFLKKYLPKLAKSKITGEYYLTSLVELASKNKERIADFPAGKIPWQGINTEEDLKEAEKLLLCYDKEHG